MREISLIALLVVSVLSCNRAGVRVPGASLAFPETSVEFRASAPIKLSLYVAPARDLRSEHVGEVVGGGRWKACRTDPLWVTTASDIVRERILVALSASGIFSRVHANPDLRADLVLLPEIHAFCSQAIGFIFVRVAGITALRLHVTRVDDTMFDRKFEKVVTDADPEYTGAFGTTVEQAMQRTMADSLRELLNDALPQLADSARSWPPPLHSGFGRQ
jgi:hypothetical protein